MADRTSRRAVMVTADVVRIVSQGAMAVLVITGAAEIWMLAALAGITGAATGFFNPASTGLLPEVVPEDELQPANALAQRRTSGSEILGPALAGVLVAAAGAGWAIARGRGDLRDQRGLPRAAPPARPRAARARAVPARPARGLDAFRSRRWVWAAWSPTSRSATWSGAAWSALGPTVAERDLGGAAVWGTRPRRPWASARSPAASSPPACGRAGRSCSWPSMEGVFGAAARVPRRRGAGATARAQRLRLRAPR